MEPKINIGDTSSRGLTFAVDHLSTALRLGWPYLVLALISQIIFVENGSYSYSYHSQLGTQMTYPDSWPLFWLAVGFYLLSILVFIPVSVLLYRMAANETDAPGGFLYLQWGSRETNLLLATILFFLILVAAMIGAMAPFMLLLSGGLVMGISNEVATLLMIVGVVIFSFLMLWFLVRACLILPVAAIEDRLAFRDAFNMTKGHFWRLLGIFALLFLVLLGAQLLLFLAGVVLGLLLSVMGLGVQGLTVGGVLMSTISLVVGLFISLVMIGVAGSVWQTLNNPGSLSPADAKFPG